MPAENVNGLDERLSGPSARIIATIGSGSDGSSKKRDGPGPKTTCDVFSLSGSGQSVPFPLDGIVTSSRLEEPAWNIFGLLFHSALAHAACWQHKAAKIIFSAKSRNCENASQTRCRSFHCFAWRNGQRYFSWNMRNGRPISSLSWLAFYCSIFFLFFRDNRPQFLLCLSQQEAQLKIVGLKLMIQPWITVT